MTMKHALLVLPLAVGCAADNGDIQIVVLNNAIPEPNCVLPTSEEGPFRGRGKLNVMSDTPYLFTPRLKSFVTVTPGTSESQRIVQIQGARVSLSMADPELDPALQASGSAQFTMRFSGTIEPEGGVATVGFEIVPVTLIGPRDVNQPDTPVSVLDTILPADPQAIPPNPPPPGTQATLLAEVTIFGEMGGGGVDLESYVYPITLCRDCAGFSTPYGDCVNVPVGSMFDLPNSCNIFQDGVAVCCTSGSALVCPAVREEI